jgi:transcriptional regulator with XRE-family HTH domain
MHNKRIRELRKIKGIDQAELARRVGISQGAVSQLETGVRNCLPDTLEAIARELGCTFEELSGEPAPFVRLMRNAKGLLPLQLLLVNELVLQIKHQPPADSSESAGTSTNTGMAAEAAQICDHCGPEDKLEKLRMYRVTGYSFCPHCGRKLRHA